MAVVAVTEENFEEEVIKSEKPVLVDFWAVWCGPCRMLSPTVESIAESNPDIKVCKVNIDEQPGLAQEFRIMSIPTLISFRDGKIVNKSVGVISEEEILDMI